MRRLIFRKKGVRFRVLNLPDLRGDLGNQAVSAAQLFAVRGCHRQVEPDSDNQTVEQAGFQIGGVCFAENTPGLFLTQIEFIGSPDGERRELQGGKSTQNSHSGAAGNILKLFGTKSGMQQKAAVNALTGGRGKAASVVTPPGGLGVADQKKLSGFSGAKQTRRLPVRGVYLPIYLKLQAAAVFL